LLLDHTDCARHMAEGLPHILTAPRAAALCRQLSLRCIVFAITLVVLAGILPAVASSALPPASSQEYFDDNLDRDRNGVEDLLDRWLSGDKNWTDLRLAAAPDPVKKSGDQESFPKNLLPSQSVWEKDLIRLICLGSHPGSAKRAVEKASENGQCRMLHDLEAFGGVQVLALDSPGLKSFLQNKPNGRILLDRNGTPALDTSIRQMGGRQAAAGYWQLGSDWSGTVAILDSGCDSAHDDLGDPTSDNVDGPPPTVGDANDWSPGDVNWPTQNSFRIVGWKDVTDDFPQAQGPWDYHHHGTALASVVAGSGRILEDHKGVAPGGRLTVVKFYDFDQVWHTWAGDYLAACAWTLANREAYRIRVVLSAVNWDEDLGISDAMNEMISAGLLPVVAMGNYGESQSGPGFPAAVADVLTVGSVNDAGAVSAFSGRGLIGAGKPDLMAPGGGLLPFGGRISVADNEPNDTYSERLGTSLAAAHVAGAVLLLDEALRDNGIVLPPEVEAVQTIRALLRSTSGRIDQMENLSGTALLPMTEHDVPDEIRGWGQLRIDSAVDAVLRPLFPGADQTDTLTSDNYRTVIARRLVLQPGVRYLVEADPTADLDVDLTLVEPGLLVSDPFGSGLSRENDGASGASEFIFCEPDQWGFVYLVVRRVSGQGPLSLRLREADSFVYQGRLTALPGDVSAPPNTGHLNNVFGTAVVIPTLVDVDSNARSVNVMDSWGLEVPGWPVYLFPNPSAIGGLSQPMVWDMDGVDGDEIVLASDYGSLYFFNNLGAYHEVVLPINRALTAPVCLLSDGSLPRIAVVDTRGVLGVYSWGPTLEITRDLGFESPLQPAAGSLAADEPERLIVAFSDGHLTVLDLNGLAQPGWPLNLGTSLTQPPVLADIDNDGDREILLPVFDQDTGIMRLRLFESNGTTANYDGTFLPAPEGGSWLEMSWPLMAGLASTGDLRLELVGLYSNNLTGDETRWGLGRSGWFAGGSPISESMPSLKMVTTTSQSSLQMEEALMAPPLAWDFQDGLSSEVMFVGAFQWREILYGLTSLPGSSLGWFTTRSSGHPLDDKQPMSLGGVSESEVSSVAGVLVPISGDLFLKVQIRDNVVHFLPLRSANRGGSSWTSARADQRNSGAYPLVEDLSPVAAFSPVSGDLTVYPNPGPGRFQFAWKGEQTDIQSDIDIFDLRGRLVTTIRPNPNKSGTSWDGRDVMGRKAAAGTYLAVASRRGQQSVVRVVLTR
jgi:Subtilase family